MNGDELTTESPTGVGGDSTLTWSKVYLRFWAISV